VVIFRVYDGEAPVMVICPLGEVIVTLSKTFRVVFALKVTGPEIIKFL
jgi:hypothetical protein